MLEERDSGSIFEILISCFGAVQAVVRAESVSVKKVGLFGTTALLVDVAIEIERNLSSSESVSPC